MNNHVSLTLGECKYSKYYFMENREQQILSEIKSMMASIRSQLEMLDTKMAELQQVVDPEDFASESVDLDIDMEETVEASPVEEVTVQEIPMEEPVEETPEEPDDDLPFAEIPEASPEDDDLPEAAPAPAEDDDDLPGIFDEPETITVAAKAKAEAKPTINDMLAADCAWRRDMPGAQVKDVRSAISLNDRVIFINLLFNEDAQAFVNALTQINAMETLDQAVEYVTSSFPSWDMNSELVYRFMMAVRRKVR